jgi:hypothetical protein
MRSERRLRGWSVMGFGGVLPVRWVGNGQRMAGRCGSVNGAKARRMSVTRIVAIAPAKGGCATRYVLFVVTDRITLADNQDDILPTFGGSNDDLGREVTTAWLSFVKTLDPNPTGPGNKGLKNRWNQFTANSGDKDVRAIGGGKVMECPKDFWGKKVQFDREVYT